MTTDLSQAERELHMQTAQWLARVTVNALQGAGGWIAHFDRLTGACPAVTFDINTLDGKRLNCRVSGVRYEDGGMTFMVLAQHQDESWTREHAGKLRVALEQHYHQGVLITSQTGSTAATYFVPGWREAVLMY